MNPDEIKGLGGYNWLVSKIKKLEEENARLTKLLKQKDQ
jgi:cell shape-determining protein MreC